MVVNRARFTAAEMLPCAGQGALAVETRADAHVLNARLAALSHRPTLLAVTAERAVSRGLGGSCSMPLAAYAMWEADGLELRAVVGHPERHEAPLVRAHGRSRVVDEAAAEALGHDVAGQLLAAGAGGYLGAAEALAAALHRG